MIDFVTKVEPGKLAEGYKNLPDDEWFFPIHFPGNPNMPGALQLEALAQMLTVAITTLPGNKGKVTHAISHEVKFKKEVLPNRKYIIKTKVNSWKRGICIGVGQGFTDLAVAENRRALKDYEREQADYEAGMDEENSNRAFAIRQSMEAYGFTEQEILDAIEAAGYKAGGRVGLANGGEPGIMGNPAVMEKIENMREFMIANPDIEDITDYSEKYESKDPEFEGIKSAVKKINKDEINEEKEILEDNNMFSNLINKVSSVFVDEKGDYRSGLQKAKFVLSDFIAGKGYDFVTGAEWYNKLDDETQKEILLMKQKIRDNPERYGFSSRMKELTEQPVYDEEFAGKFGYGSRYANGGRINAEEGGLMNLGGREMDMRGGGFIPIGKKERADDVPARLSKNEFVMTADAVRAAGGGSVNKGAKRMYDVMNKLEARA